MNEERFHEWVKPQLKHGEPTRWLWVVWHPEHFVMGERTDIGAFTCLFAHEGIEIGNEVQIGSHCAIYSRSTIDGRHGKVTLKQGCRIGTHCTVMPGVTIGENTIVGAHSFVNGDLPANVVAWGVPAKVIRSRTP